MIEVFSLDTETALIEQGLLCPPLACVSWASGLRSGLVERREASSFIRSLLLNPDALLVLHNGAFDFAVLANFDPSLLPLIFKKYDEGLIHDTLLQEKLLDIRAGHLGWERSGNVKKKYALGSLIGGLDKDTWRLRYGELVEVPLNLWPQGAKDYAIEDAKATLSLYRRQLETNGGSPITDLAPQCRADFALQLMSAWGIRADGDKVDKLESSLWKESEGLEVSLRKCGFIRDNGTRDLNAIRSRIKEICPSPELTEKGSISTASGSLAKFDDPSLSLLTRFCEIQKILSTYLPPLKQAVHLPLNASYNVLLKSGRTSCYKPNLQNLPRSSGVRECFVPREGNLFCSVDYDSLELRTLAQVLYKTVRGQTLLKYYNENPHFDPHSRLASQILGVSFAEGLKRKQNKDPEFKNTRQMAKIANFGYGGGMGPKKFIEYAFASYGVSLSLAESTRLRQNWFAFIPEMRSYFDMISDLTQNGRGSITQIFSGRVRGGVGFCDGANGFFQSLAADGCKLALWNIAKKAYGDPSSPLFGTRPVVFVHDEVILEVPRGTSSEAAFELSKVMCESMAEFCPDVPITASPSLMDCWLKDAEPCFDSNNKLVPWSLSKAS